MAEQTNVWEQAPGEPNRWYRRFEIYRRLGTNRSLLAAYSQGRAKKATTVGGAWRAAAQKWDWAKRAAAWDGELSQREEAEWETRRAQLRKQEWEASQALLDKARQMLVFPLAKTTRQERDEAGRLVAETVINPAKWTQRDAVAMFEISSKLGRLAADMVTNKIAVDDWRSAAIEAGFDPDELFNEVVTSIRKRMAKYDGGGASNSAEAGAGTGAGASGTPG